MEEKDPLKKLHEIMASEDLSSWRTSKSLYNEFKQLKLPADSAQCLLYLKEERSFLLDVISHCQAEYKVKLCKTVETG